MQRGARKLFRQAEQPPPHGRFRSHWLRAQDGANFLSNGAAQGTDTLGTRQLQDPRTSFDGSGPTGDQDFPPSILKVASLGSCLGANGARPAQADQTATHQTNPTFPWEDRCLPYLASFEVKIAIVRQNSAKLGKAQGSQPEFSPFSSRMRAWRAQGRHSHLKPPETETKSLLK